MNTWRKTLATFLTSLAIGTASCDGLPLAPDARTNPAVATAASHDASDPSSADEVPHRFRIDVALVDPGAREWRAQILSAAGRWINLVRDTDLEEIDWEPGPIWCAGLTHDFQGEVLDDLFVLVSVRDIDGAGGTAVKVKTCGYRDSSLLPLIGAILLDRADLDRMERGDGYDLILHGFGHMLGYGLSPRWRDLLREPSRENAGADTHFAGARAIGAFDAAGGTDYHGAKVPVQNRPGQGSRDKHWRESVLGPELMTPLLQAGVSDLLSAITVQSLADLGYTVDLELAQAYTLPGTAGGAAASARKPGPPIDLSGDVIMDVAVLYGRDGRAVGMLRH